MTEYRRAWQPGGTWFFTVNLAERRGNRLLVERKTYRDHLPGEVRDIAAIAWPGIPQAKPVLVHQDNWVLDGCPGQYVGVSATQKRLGVAWFTGAGNQGKVRVAFTQDPRGGFSKPIDLDPTNPQGEVKMVMIDDNHAVVHWIRVTEQGPLLQLALVSADGQVLAKEPINTPQWEQGFEWPSLPSMERVGDKVYFAWLDKEKQQVRMAAIKRA